MRVEPYVKYATVREGLDEDGIIENHIECRLSDGQKFAAIIVDGSFDNLAFDIRDFLNSDQYQKKTFSPKEE